MSLGSFALEGFIPDFDATVVTRVLQAANYPHLFIYGSGGSGRTRYRGAERIMRYIDVRSLRW